MKLMLDCQTVSRLISEGQDLQLPTPERARMRLHFAMCQSCRNVNEQFGILRQAMRRMGRDEPEDGPPRDPDLR